MIARLLPSLHPAEIWRMPEILVLTILDAAAPGVGVGAGGSGRSEWVNPVSGARHVKLSGGVDLLADLFGGKLE